MLVPQETINRVKSHLESLHYALSFDPNFHELAKYKGLVKEYALQIGIACEFTSNKPGNGMIYTEMAFRYALELKKLGNALMCVGNANFFQLEKAFNSAVKAKCDFDIWMQANLPPGIKIEEVFLNKPSRVQE